MSESKMVSETTLTRNEPRLFGGDIAGPATLVGWSRQPTNLSIDELGNVVTGRFSAVVSNDLVEDNPATYKLFVDNPISNVISAPSGPGLWGLAVEVRWAYPRGIADLGYATPLSTSDPHTSIDVADPGNIGFFNENELRASDLAGPWRALVNPTDAREDYKVIALNYGQEAPWPEIEYGTQPSSLYSSIDEIIAAINSIGEPRIAARLEYLTSEEIVEAGEIPIGLQVCTAFLEFFTELKNDAYLNLTCAKGWLCAEWDFPDGGSVIVWFMDRDAARVTVFDSEDKLVDVSASQQVRDRSVIMENLERSGYFSWRTKH